MSTSAIDRETLGINGIIIVKETCVPSLNPKICLGTSAKGGGRGLYAKELIRKGEWTWKEVDGFESIPRNHAWIEALPEAARRAYQHFSYCIGHDTFSSLPEFDRLDPSEWPTTPSSDDSMYMNHSCDPTNWFTYPDGKITDACDTMVATRDILPGEEITFDYGTSEAYPQWNAFECRCGAPDCRGQLKWDDWKRPAMQRKYAGHFLIHVAEMVAKHHTTSEFGLRVSDDAAGHKTLLTSSAIPKGTFVMIIAPNVLVKKEEVTNPANALQVAPGLWTVSLSDDDLENALTHSCEPSLTGVIREDYGVELFATRDIAPGDALTIDYEQFEDDLGTFGTAFDCACGTATCRGRIVGSKVRGSA